MQGKETQMQMQKLHIYIAYAHIYSYLWKILPATALLEAESVLKISYVSI